MKSVRSSFVLLALSTLLTACGGADSPAPENAKTQAPEQAGAEPKRAVLTPEEGAKRYQTVSSARLSLTDVKGPRGGIPFWGDGAGAECTTSRQDAIVRNMVSPNGDVLNVTQSGGTAEAVITDRSGKTLWTLAERAPVSGVMGITVVLDGNWSNGASAEKGKLVVTCR